MHNQGEKAVGRFPCQSHQSLEALVVVYFSQAPEALESSSQSPEALVVVCFSQAPEAYRLKR